MLLAIKAGLSWGKPPSFFLGRSDSWTECDRIVALGFQIIETEQCPECGNPVSVCRDPGMSGRFRVEEQTCFAKEAVENAQKDIKEPTPGQLLYPVRDAAQAPAGEEATNYGARPW